MKKLPINESPKISRKKAITKIGLTALSITSMMILLNEPAKGDDSGDSPDVPPEWP